MSGVPAGVGGRPALRRREGESGGAAGEAAATGGNGRAADPSCYPETAAMPRNRNPLPPSGDLLHRSWRARLIVSGPLAGVALAAVAGAGPCAPLWAAALAWAALASLAGALAHGVRSGGFSAFRGSHGLRSPEEDGELDEWASRTGRYVWFGEMEDRLRDDGRLHDKDGLV